ncbi:MAG TPA: hypothetical protein VKV21_03125 [Solirubrobacteraceae bacterium]|nr:hypothetical protein [Solirubrobacteraceae bacterium]
MGIVMYDCLIDDSLSPRPFGRSLQEAIRWMLIDATDLMPQLERADPYGALYVGRRVDQAWRRIEHFAADWLREDYQDTEPELRKRDLERVIEAAGRLPAIPAAEDPAECWVACARDALLVAGDAVNALEPDPHLVGVQMRIAREAFSLYRLAKYRWLAQAMELHELAQVAYQALEA